MKRVTLEDYLIAKNIARKYEKQIKNAGKLLCRYRRQEQKKNKLNIKNRLTDATGP